MYHWTADQITKAHDNNKGPVQSVMSKNEGGKEIVLVGGNDKTVTGYEFTGQL